TLTQCHRDGLILPYLLVSEALRLLSRDPVQLAVISFTFILPSCASARTYRRVILPAVSSADLTVMLVSWLPLVISGRSGTIPAWALSVLGSIAERAFNMGGPGSEWWGIRKMLSQCWTTLTPIPVNGSEPGRSRVTKWLRTRVLSAGWRSAPR